MTRLAYTRAYVDQEFLRDAGKDDPIRFVGATEGEKGDGIALKMDGARLDRYRANPIFGYGHRYAGRDSLPIGRSERTEVDAKKRMLFDINFDRDDEFAVKVERKYRNKFMNAVSIGFAVHEWEDPKTQDYWRGGVAVDWELYELSAVPLPMDANAVVESGRGAGTLAVEQELLDSVRGLLDRLDGAAIAQLRSLLDFGAVADGLGERGAIKKHTTATVDEPWDGPAAVAAAPNDAAVLRYMHAWVKSGADTTVKDSYKFPHHNGKGAPANLNGCRNGLARLSQADIPDADRAGVEAHLQAHLDAAKKGVDEPDGSRSRLAIARRRLQLADLI